MKLGGLLKYHIYAFHAGTFIKEGDGGWLNWAFEGKELREWGKKSVTVVFGKP